jgi:hypothetical protein
MLVNTVESSNKSTPVIGIVMEDVYEERNGARHLIIPSGTVRSDERFVRVPSGTQFYIIPIAS